MEEFSTYRGTTHHIGVIFSVSLDIGKIVFNGIVIKNKGVGTSELPLNPLSTVGSEVFCEAAHGLQPVLKSNVDITVRLTSH